MSRLEVLFFFFFFFFKNWVFDSVQETESLSSAPADPASGPLRTDLYHTLTEGETADFSPPCEALSWASKLPRVLWRHLSNRGGETDVLSPPCEAPFSDGKLS